MLTNSMVESDTVHNRLCQHLCAVPSQNGKTRLDFQDLVTYHFVTSLYTSLLCLVGRQSASNVLRSHSPGNKQINETSMSACHVPECCIAPNSNARHQLGTIMKECEKYSYWLDAARMTKRLVSILSEAAKKLAKAGKGTSSRLNLSPRERQIGLNTPVMSASFHHFVCDIDLPEYLPELFRIMSAIASHMFVKEDISA